MYKLLMETFVLNINSICTYTKVNSTGVYLNILGIHKVFRFCPNFTGIM